MFPNLNVIFSISQLRLNSLLNSFLLSLLSVPLRYFSGRGKIKSTQSWIMVFNTILYKKKIYCTCYYCHGKKSNSSLDNLNYAYLKPVAGSSSSSSSHYPHLDSPTWALTFFRSFCQLKYPAIVSSDFVISLFQVRSSAPRPTPGCTGRPMFSVRVVSLSWLVPILKCQDLDFCPSMT
jgi:hypothetical protein